MFTDENAVLTLTQLGLTVLESKIYIVLCKYGSLPTRKISKLTKMAQSDVYRVADGLQQKGLVERKICKNDRRKSDVKVTSKGLELLSKLEPIDLEVERTLKALSNDEAEKLNNLLVVHPLKNPKNFNAYQ